MLCLDACARAGRTDDVALRYASPTKHNRHARLQQRQAPKQQNTSQQITEVCAFVCFGQPETCTKSVKCSQPSNYFVHYLSKINEFPLKHTTIDHFKWLLISTVDQPGTLRKQRKIIQNRGFISAFAAITNKKHHKGLHNKTKPNSQLTNASGKHEYTTSGDRTSCKFFFVYYVKDIL